jgi:hypothetical protein
VVSSEDEEILWVLDLVGEQEADGLHRLLPTVNVVTEEQVVGLRRLDATERTQGDMSAHAGILERVTYACAWAGELNGRQTELGAREGEGATHEASVLEQPEQVVVLSVDISTDLDRRLTM